MSHTESILPTPQACSYFSSRCLLIHHLPYGLCEETRSYISQRDFIPFTSSPLIFYHLGFQVNYSLKFSLICSWYDSATMFMFSLQPHLSALSFLICLYRTLQSSHLFHTFSLFWTFAAASLSFQDSAHTLSPVKGMSFSNTLT